LAASYFYSDYIVYIAWYGNIDFGIFMSPPSEKPMLTFVIDIDLLNRVDDFRYDNRFPTRAGAIRWLLEWALKQTPPSDKHRRSK